MKPLGMALLFLTLVAPTAAAQTVVDPLVASVDFFSADHSAVIPAGFPSAGQPTVTSYQGFLFPVAADVTTATPSITGVVVPKATAVGNPAGTARRLTLAQLGLTALPACTAVAPATCPQFKVTMVAIGPGGTTARTAASTSDSFLRASLAPNPLPAAPSAVVIAP